MRNIFLILCFFTISKLFGQEGDNNSFLKYHWFQKKGEVFIPVLGEIESNAIYLFITKNESGTIEICNEDEYDVWIDNQLIFAEIKSGCIQIESSKFLELNDADTSYLRISSSNLSRLSTSLISQENSKNGVLVSRTEGDWLHDFLMVYTVIVLVLGALYRQSFYLKFRKSLRNPFNFKIRAVVAQNSYSKFISPDNLFALLFLSLFLSGLLLVINAELGLFNIPQENLFSAISFWLMLSLAFFLFCIAKYFVALLLAKVFNLRNFPNIQVQDFIHFMTFVSGITFVLVLIDFSFNSVADQFFLDSARFLVIVAILFFQLWFFLKFVKYYSHRKLLIISYLCTTEFLPGFMAAYWLLN
ncbi:MAG: DUF4271 domain-containing protein [Cyclobacteriaceae bacterium]